jgi:RNA polymerase sigma-70 factor (ECF subfamily)
VLATLIRLLGDFDTAEEALQDAFTAAADQWPREGLPANPRSWLISTGRFKAIDRMRRRVRFDAALGELAMRLEETGPDPAELEAENVPDDRLRLIFTCCHPGLPPDAQVAMTLRELCGLTTEEIARAFLTGAPTIAQRIVRAKAKIKADRIPYEVPADAELPERLDAVLRVVYLVFTEGYDASVGRSLTRSDLIEESVRLGRLLVELLPDPEVRGLLALMLLHDSRRRARTGPDGQLVLLPEQDRSLWDRSLIEEGERLAREAMASPPVGSYAIQAAIAAEHAGAATTEDTDWGRIVNLYDLLVRADPSPVVELNRAVAVAMRDGPAAGLEIVDKLLVQRGLDRHHLAHSARADLLRRLGRTEEARAAYERALELADQGTERRFLERRLEELPSNA